MLFVGLLLGSSGLFVRVALLRTEIDRLQLFDQLLKCGALEVLFDCYFAVVIGLELRQGAQVDVVTQVAEERRRNAPKNALLTAGFRLLRQTDHCVLGGLRVDDFMKASKHIAASDPLKHDPGLHEQASVRDFARHLCLVAFPDEKARVARLTVDSDEVQIVVETSERRADVVALQVRTSRRQQMCTELHPGREGGLFDAEPDGDHLSRGLDRTNHVVAPPIHSLLPLWERSRDHFGQVVVDLLRALADWPKEPPLGVELGRELGQRPVLLGQALSKSLVVARLLNRLVGCACLVAQLRMAVL